MAFGCLGAFAQIEDEPIIAPSGTLYSIPADFTKSGKAQIIVHDYYYIDDNSHYDFYVYDEGINLLATIHSSDAYEFPYTHQGTRRYDKLYLTQTLFNDDDKYEYVRFLPNTGFDKNGIQIATSSSYRDLASDASNAVNGHILYVDGGILAYIGKQPK